jgi:hypothetical protein
LFRSQNFGYHCGELAKSGRPAYQGNICPTYFDQEVEIFFPSIIVKVTGGVAACLTDILHSISYFYRVLEAALETGIGERDDSRVTT